MRACRGRAPLDKYSEKVLNKDTWRELLSLIEN